jgi:hypothetical protein
LIEGAPSNYGTFDDITSKFYFMDNRLLLLQKLYNDLADLPGEDYEKHLSQLTEEQPYLMGFLFNYAEELSEDELDFLIHCALVVSQAFKALTYPMQMISMEQFEKVVQTQVASFDKFFESEAFSMEGLFQACSSPDTVAVFFNSFLDNQEDDTDQEHWITVLMAINLAVALIEESVTTELDA